MLTAIVNLLRGYTTGFNDYERAILVAVAEKLPPAAKARFNNRISALRMIQRHGGGQEVIGYQKLQGKIVFPEETRLSTDNGDVVLASFRVYSKSPMSALKGKLWLGHGNFCILEFNKPAEHAEAEEIERIAVELGPLFLPV